MKIVMVSGGFDPLHIGHLDLFRRASVLGYLIVALNSDEWLRRKKGFAFMPWNERREILINLWMVKEVVKVEDADGSICAALRKEQPKIFCNGGDRLHGDPRESEVCKELGIQEVFNLGMKTQSSTKLVAEALE